MSNNLDVMSTQMGLSWVTTKRLDSRIQAADINVLRLIKGVTRRDKIRNVDIYERRK